MQVLQTIIDASQMMYYAFLGFANFLNKPVFNGWGSSFIQLLDRNGLSTPLLRIANVESLHEVTVLQLLFGSIIAFLGFKLVKWLWDLLPFA